MAMNIILRTIKQSFWLGWKVETNWADPLVFAIYYLIRPISGLLIIGFIFIIGSAASGVSSNPQFFTYMFVGNSFFTYLMQIMMTMTTIIHEDRAHYEVLTQIYLTPGSISWYIFGRALNGILNASISLLLTLGFGIPIFQGLLGVPIFINWLEIDYPLLFLSLILGISCFIAIGFILCGINIVTSRVQFMLTDYVSGILNLFGGVVFTPTILPAWGQTISNALPITYFLNIIRYSILHQSPLDIQTNLINLILTMIATSIAGFLVFRISLHKARRDGLLNNKEEY